MRKLISLAGLLFTLTLGGVAAAAPALADAATPGHFAYTDALFGPVTCNEVHHDTNSLPGNFPAGAVTKGGYDTITCQITNGAPALAGKDFTDSWFSDFGTRFDQHGGVIEIHVDGGGGTYHGDAWYPAG